MEQEFVDLYKFKDLVEEFLKTFKVVDHYEQESTGEACYLIMRICYGLERDFDWPRIKSVKLIKNIIELKKLDWKNEKRLKKMILSWQGFERVKVIRAITPVELNVFEVTSAWEGLEPEEWPQTVSELESIAAAVFEIKSICKKLKDYFGWSKEKRNYFMESVAANFKNKSKWEIFVEIWDYMTG